MLNAKSKPHSRNTKSQTISTVHTSKENQKRENQAEERETLVRGERVSASHPFVACAGHLRQPWGLAV